MTPTYNTINSNLLKKLLPDIEKTEDRITTLLTRHSLVIKSIWEHGMKSAAQIWSKFILKLPKTIYNFSICCVNNSLANASNMHKWGKTTSSLCLHCNKNQTRGHVAAGCETLLREKRYNYRHDFILLNVGRILEFPKSIGIT